MGRLANGLRPRCHLFSPLTGAARLNAHMTRPLILLAPIALLAALGACRIIPEGAEVESASQPQAGAAALGQTVTVGALRVTPQEVVEDSRCPVNARCVWAGRLVVRARIAGAGWTETTDLTLGEPRAVRGTNVALTSGNPAPETGREVAAADYRFTFEAR